MPRPVVPIAFMPRAASRARSSTTCEGSISGQAGEMRSRSNTGTGSAALPETSSRAGRNARAAASSATTRDHTVGTPKYSVPPASARAWA